MAREGHCRWMAVLVLPILAGCRSGRAPDYKTYAPPTVAYAPASGSPNGFDGYALAALEAERSGGKNLTRVSFFPAQRAEAQKSAAAAIQLIQEAAKKPCAFRFSPRGPLDPAPFQTGWRLIGRCLTWKVQDACAAKDFRSAVRDTVLATRFGFDLCGGGATDVSLGLAIADGARRALAPYLTQLGAAELDQLNIGLKLAIVRQPPLSQAIENEQQNMLQAVQAIQDAYRKGDLDRYVAEFGPSIRDAMDRLKDMGPEDPRRSQFFDSLDQYCRAVAQYAKQAAPLPAGARARIPVPTPPTDRSTRRLARLLARSPLPMIAMNDATTARTRLFILEAELTRQRDLKMPLPKDLSRFSRTIATDPYTGRPFVYKTDGIDYSVYSVGSDGLDDGGQTDSSYTSPDLRLERPSS